MSGTITLTALCTEISKRGKLGAGNAVEVYEYFHPHYSAFMIAVPILKIEIIVSNKTGRLHLSKDGGFANPVAEYITYLVSNDVLVIRDIDCTDSTPNHTSSQDIILFRYDNMHDTIKVISYCPTTHDAIDITKSENPFERMIHSKPSANAEIFKDTARRLVSTGFTKIDGDFRIEDISFSRVYVYRDIFIGFYRDTTIYVGLSQNSEPPAAWREFSNITPDILDTQIFEYIKDIWNPSFVI